MLIRLPELPCPKCRAEMKRLHDPDPSECPRCGYRTLKGIIEDFGDQVRAIFRGEMKEGRNDG